MKNIKFKKLGNGYILVNYNTFEQINPLQFNYVWDFYNGIAKVYKDGRGNNFINEQGELLWKEYKKFDDVFNFGKGVN